MNVFKLFLLLYPLGLEFFSLSLPCPVAGGGGSGVAVGVIVGGGGVSGIGVGDLVMIIVAPVLPVNLLRWFSFAADSVVEFVI